MTDLIELIFAEDGKTLIRKDNGHKVDARPIGQPQHETYSYWFPTLNERARKFEESCRQIGVRDKRKPEDANAFILGKATAGGELDYYTAGIAVQFYSIYQPNLFRELYEGIVSHIEQHPEVELRGESVDHGPFADVNLNLYVVPYQMIRDALRLNEILHNLAPEGINPTEKMDAFVSDGFPVLNFGALGFKMEIGEKRTLKSYTGMPHEELLKKIEEENIIKLGVYTAGIRLKIFPHKKFVFQNINGQWVPEKYSCDFYELDELEKMDKNS